MAVNVTKPVLDGKSRGTDKEGDKSEANNSNCQELLIEDIIILRAGEKLGQSLKRMYKIMRRRLKQIENNTYLSYYVYLFSVIFTGIEDDFTLAGPV